MAVNFVKYNLTKLKCNNKVEVEVEVECGEKDGKFYIVMLGPAVIRTVCKYSM